jgi:hypothetical protein
MYIFIAILIFLSALSEAISHELTPASIRRELEIRQPGDVMSEIWRSTEHAKQLILGVRSVDLEWLVAAKELSAGFDASISEELDEALAVALLKSPYQVLPWLKDRWWNGTRQVCRFGFDDDLPGGLGSYIEKLKIALLQTPPEDKLILRDDCLLGLKNY